MRGSAWRCRWRWRRTDDQRAAVPGHRRRGHHRLDDRRPAGRRRARRKSSCWTTWSAAGGRTWPARWRRAPSRLVEGDIRDRGLVTGLMDGIDLVFHQAAIRITQCADRAQARAGGAGRRHLRGRRGGGRRRRPQGGRRVVGVGLRAGRGVPDHREAPPVRQRHHLRGGQDLQRGAAAELPAMRGLRLRGAALLQRVRAADGHLRPVHRGPHPVDGADRGGRAAAHPRRRPADDGLRLHRGHRPGEPARRRRRRDRRGVQHRQRDRDQPRRARRDAAPGHGQRPGAGVRAGARRQRGDPAAGRRLGRRRAPRLEGRGRPGGGPARLVSWWRAERAKGTDPGALRRDRARARAVRPSR